MKPYPPLGILYISAWLDNNGITNDVFDTTFSRKQLLYNYLDKEKPAVIAFYTNLMTKVNVIEAVKYIRSNPQLKESVIVLGGPDVRHNKKDYLDTGANIVVFGEGEQTMLEIVKAVQAGMKNEFGHVDGIAYYSDGALVETKERTRIRPVDSIPFPNRHKINMQQYLDVWKKHHGKSAMTVSTQRGCPYTCKWCSTAVYGQSYRRRSPKIVVEELKHIKETYNPDTIWFVDDVFSVSHKWIEGFKNELIKQDVHIPFECITRADRMDEQVIDWLKEAGCFRVWIGAESGSQKVIDLMDRRVSVEQVRHMIQLTRKKGMQAGTFIMLGYPGETEEDIFETVKHLKACNPDYFTITIAYPIKGTSLYNEIEAIQTSNLEWDKSTDRDRDFQRKYSRKYYEYAVKWVDNEVRWYQKRKENNWQNTTAFKYKLKSLLNRSMMRVVS